jgi:hypothetical protein
VATGKADENVMKLEQVEEQWRPSAWFAIIHAM